MKIFISYRHADSSPIVGRIYDRLVTEFGRSNVFRDINFITPGEDIHEAVIEALTKYGVDIVLVVIGSQWVTITDTHGNKRLDDPNDVVRLEVQIALNLRTSITTIPLLVNNAQMPKIRELPDVLAKLPSLSALRIRPTDPDFGTDIVTLIAQLRLINVTLPRTSRSRKKRYFLFAVFISVVLIAVAVGLFLSNLSTPPSPTATFTASTSVSVLTTFVTTVPPPTSTTPAFTPTFTDTVAILNPIFTLSPSPTATVTLSPTATLSPSLVPTATPSGNLVIFAERDVLTILLYDQDIISLHNFGFQASVSPDLIFLRDYSTLKDTISNLSTPSCIQVIPGSSDESAVEPECRNLTGRAPLSGFMGNNFWFDGESNQTKEFNLVLGTQIVGTFEAGQPDGASQTFTIPLR